MSKLMEQYNGFYIFYNGSNYFISNDYIPFKFFYDKEFNTVEEARWFIDSLLQEKLDHHYSFYL